MVFLADFFATVSVTFGWRERGSGQLDSDVDVLVEFEAHRDLLDRVEVKQYLKSVLGLPVDVTTPSGIRRAGVNFFIDGQRAVAVGALECSPLPMEVE